MTRAPPAPPKTVSDTYAALADTAKRFLDALASPLPTGDLDAPLLASLCAQNFTHTFGPAYFVSQRSHLQGEFDISGLVAHVERMLPALDEAKLEKRHVVVDEEARRVVARVTYGMRVRGSGECVEHEVGWWMEVDAEGKLAQSREVVDGFAAARIGELIQAVVN
jgi:ketosteroid isomerase-like protein